MKKANRYETSHLIEDQYEPGSYGKVLKNRLGIKRVRSMNLAEVDEHSRALNYIMRAFGRDHSLTERNVCDMHKMWLGPIYEWAGKYRAVNISKGNFTFAMAQQIPKLMSEFENDVLSKFTPCQFKTLDEVSHAIAVVHVELVLIHPFRDGNGRTARLLSIVMALQAGLPVLDFKSIEGRNRQKYFAAVQAGLNRDYEPMKNIYDRIIKRSIKKYSSGR